MNTFCVPEARQKASMTQSRGESLLFCVFEPLQLLWKTQIINYSVSFCVLDAQVEASLTQSQGETSSFLRLWTVFALTVYADTGDYLPASASQAHPLMRSR